MLLHFSHPCPPIAAKSWTIPDRTTFWSHDCRTSSMTTSNETSLLAILLVASSPRLGPQCVHK